MFGRNSFLNNQKIKHTPVYCNIVDNQPFINDQNKINHQKHNDQKQNEIIIETPIIQLKDDKNILSDHKLTDHQTNNDKIDKINFIDKDELYNFINSKFSKIDDALLSFKQERYPIKNDINDFQDDEHDIKHDKKKELLKSRAPFEEEKSNKKPKKSYETIDDSLFDKVKEKYPNFPEDKKHNIVIDNDGNFFINKNKKKLPLNNVNTLKIINKKF
jgi:hypothetical protein